MVSVAAKTGCAVQTLHDGTKAEVDGGKLAGVSSEVVEKLRAGAREPRAAAGRRDPAQGVGVFCRRWARPPVQATTACVDEHRGAHGVEPVCRVLPAKPQSDWHGITPFTCHDRIARRADPSRLPVRARRDAGLQVEIRRMFEENLGIYGTRKMWRQLRCEGSPVARCTVAWLMRGMRLAGVVRGKPVRTTVSDKPVGRPGRPCGEVSPRRCL